MRFLGDMGVSPVTIGKLRLMGYEAVHLVEERLERLPDAEICIKAKAENRIILTFDLDFAELLALSGDDLPSVVLFRLKNAHPNIVLEKLLSVLPVCAPALESGAIVTIQDNRYRLRRLPIQGSDE